MSVPPFQASGRRVGRVSDGAVDPAARSCRTPGTTVVGCSVMRGTVALGGGQYPSLTRFDGVFPAANCRDLLGGDPERPIHRPAARCRRRAG